MNRDSCRHAVRPKDKTVAKVEVEEVGGEGDEEEVRCHPCGGSEEEETGERFVKKMQSPLLPSAKEIDEHNLTHFPYRSWCRHCVRGRGKEASHVKAQNEPGDVPEFHFDWCFPGEEEAFKNLTVLVGRMRGTRMTLSALMPSKSTGEFASRRIMAFLRECGCELSKIIIKTDQEPAILSMIADVIKIRAERGGAETIPENSPTYSHQSNGVIERGVQSVEGIIRSIRSALEERISEKLNIGDAIWPWLIEYSGYLLNRCEVGKDGKTAYERSKGKRAKISGIEFGETVLWKRRPVGNALGKLAILWEDGVFLGVKGTTGELIIGAGDGV